MSDSPLRPRGTVEVTCSTPGCGWSYWLDPLDPILPDGPFACAMCDPDPQAREPQPAPVERTETR